MAKYRKNPVEAEQFWAYKRPWPEGVREPAGLFVKPFIYTPKGSVAVNNGDWIVTNAKGEKYPIKPNIFEQTYELVEEQ